MSCFAAAFRLLIRAIARSRPPPSLKEQKAMNQNRKSTYAVAIGVTLATVIACFLGVRDELARGHQAAKQNVVHSTANSNATLVAATQE
jgi:hypothetical protein